MRLGRIPWINCYPVYGAIDRGIGVRRRGTGHGDGLGAQRLAGRRRAAGERASPRWSTRGTRPRTICSPTSRSRCDGPVHSVVLFSRGPSSELDGLHRAPSPRPRARRCCSLELLCAPPLGVCARASPPRAPRPPTSASLAGLPHDAVLVIGDAALLPRRPGAAIPVRRRSRRRVEGVDRAAVRVRGVGRAAGRAGSTRCRRSIAGCSSPATGGCAHLDELAARGRGQPPACRSARLPRLSRRSATTRLSYRHLAGLTDFFRRLAQDGLVPDGSLSFIPAA